VDLHRASKPIAFRICLARDACIWWSDEQRSVHGLVNRHRLHNRISRLERSRKVHRDRYLALAFIRACCLSIYAIALRSNASGTTVHDLGQAGRSAGWSLDSSDVHCARNGVICRRSRFLGVCSCVGSLCLLGRIVRKGIVELLEKLRGDALLNSHIRTGSSKTSLGPWPALLLVLATSCGQTPLRLFGSSHAGGAAAGGATFQGGSGGSDATGGAQGGVGGKAGAGMGGANSAGGVLGTGGTVTTVPGSGGCCAAVYCPAGDTMVTTCPTSASCYEYTACGCNQVLCARTAGSGGSAGTGGSTVTGGVSGTGGTSATGGVFATGGTLGTGGTAGMTGTVVRQGVFVPTGSMTKAREYHTATLLPNGAWPFLCISATLAKGVSRSC